MNSVQISQHVSSKLTNIFKQILKSICKCLCNSVRRILIKRQIVLKKKYWVNYLIHKYLIIYKKHRLRKMKRKDILNLLLEKIDIQEK